MLLAQLAAVASIPFASGRFTARRADNSNEPHNVRSPYAEQLRPRATSDASTVTDGNYDFVIVGGGVAGLALAARLSEWSNVTVLVVEAGSDGSEFQNRIDVPGKSYLQGLTGTTYDWQYKTTEQASAGGTARAWPRGKGLGGSGAINGAFWCRGGKNEYDAWDTLQGGDKSAVSWGWDTMKKYMIKSETYTPMPIDQAKTFSLEHDVASHGTSGPIHASYSAYQFPLLSNWIPTLAALGLGHTDPAGGTNHGAAFVPSTINPANQSRSDSKAGYYISTGAVARKNLVVLTGHQVVRVFWNETTAGKAVAGGVVFAASASDAEKKVYANKEVILSGGTVGSPQVLQLSGVGPKALLTGLGIDTVIDLPVGSNLQDHASTSVTFQSTADPTWSALSDPTFAAEQEALWAADGSGMWSYLNEATAYPSIADLMGATEGQAWAAGVSSGLDGAVTATTSLNTMDAAVAKGVKAQYDVTAAMAATDEGQVEIIFNMLGGKTGAVGIQVGIQRAFSRGTVLINSDSAFTAPTINPNYFSNSWDLDIMRAGIKYLTKIGQTAPLSAEITAQTNPPTTASDDEINTYVLTTIGTEYHPCCSASMQPQANGGVVNTTLVVYGTMNLRVVDASIMPLNIAAHLMGTTYGIAEHAADLIKSSHAAVVSASSSSASGSKTGTAGGAEETGENDSAKASTGLSNTAKIAIGAGVAGLAAIVGALILFLCCRRKRAQKGAASTGLWRETDTDGPGVYANSHYTPAYTNTMDNAPLAPFMRHDDPRMSMHSSTMSFDSAHPDNAQQVQYGRGQEHIHDMNTPYQHGGQESMVSLSYRDNAPDASGGRPYRD